MTAGGSRTSAPLRRARRATELPAPVHPRGDLLTGLALLRDAVAATLSGALAPQPALGIAGDCRAGAPTRFLPWTLMAATAGSEPASGGAPTVSAVRRETVPQPSGAPSAAPPPGDASAGMMALVHRAQEGDAEAFGRLYDAYVDLVYRYIYYRVGSQALAEDLTSETFLRALRRITSFTWQGRDIGAWFVTIARNLIADHYKSGRYRLEVQVADMLDADRATDGPEGEVLDALTNRTLLEAVKKLNAEQQECIVLRFLQGLSVAETALAMGKNEGAIKALQYRAVRTLGRLLPEGFLP